MKYRKNLLALHNFALSRKAQITVAVEELVTGTGDLRREFLAHCFLYQREMLTVTMLRHIIRHTSSDLKRRYRDGAVEVGMRMESVSQGHNNTLHKSLCATLAYDETHAEGYFARHACQIK